MPLPELEPDVEGTLKSWVVDVTAGKLSLLDVVISLASVFDVLASVVNDDVVPDDAVKLIPLVEPELRLLAVIATLLPSAAAPSLPNSPELDPVADRSEPAVTLKVLVPSLEIS